MKKRFVAALICGLVVFFTVFQIYGTSIYSDLDTTHWAYKGIEAMSERGILTGYPDGSFKPEQLVSFGEFIKMMTVTEGGDPGVSPKGHWALNYYQKGLDLGLFHDHKISKTSLDREIPRGYMAYLISSGLGEFTVNDYAKIRGEITDVEVGTPFEYDIIKAYEKGILNGYPDGSFRPEGTLTRAEAAVVLSNYITVKNGGTITSDEEEMVDEETEEEIVDEEEGEEIHTTKPEVLEEIDAEWNWEDFEGLCTGFRGTKSIYEIAQNWDETLIWKNENRIVSCAPQIQYYEIFEDCPYAFELTKNKVGSKNIRVTLDSTGLDVVLIKGDKVLMFESDFGKGDSEDIRAYGKLNSTVGEGVITYYPRWKDPYYETPEDFDYIGFFVSTGDTLICIPNPLKD